MQRATQLFSFDDATVDTPFVDRLWRSHSEPSEEFISVAASHWEIIVVRQYGHAALVVRGPETYATRSPIPQEAEFIGIQFRIGTFMPCLALETLVDGALYLPSASSRSVLMNGSSWEIPTFDNADVFVDRLVREGLLVRDQLVQGALAGDACDLRALSQRSAQRRFLRATGLSHSRLKQIDRAQYAVDLLDAGVPILDVVDQAGYTDQPHLTRALTRFAGQTPARILRDRAE
jgi:AraC-like DNA-binding protein